MQHYGERRPPRGVIAGVLTFFALALPAAGVSTLGVDLYTDDYCSEADSMRGLAGGVDRVHGPRFSSPWTSECWTSGERREATDASPVLWVIGVWGGTLLLSVMAGVVAAGLESRRRVTGPWD